MDRRDVPLALKLLRVVSYASLINLLQSHPSIHLGENVLVRILYVVLATSLLFTYSRPTEVGELGLKFTLGHALDLFGRGFP